MASEDVQTNLRLPAALKDALVVAAERNNRSLSAEVAFRLVHSFSHDASLLQFGERAEMLRELHGLQVLSDTINAGLSVQKAALSMRRDSRINNGEAWTLEQKQAFGTEEREMQASIQAAERRLLDIQGRKEEIERDLLLPDWPEELASLANKMPR